jgi:hypothetical protein
MRMRLGPPSCPCCNTTPLEIIQLGIGKPHISHSYAGLVDDNPYQAIGIWVRERTQQHRIHDDEDRRVGPPAQSQRQNSHDRECGLLGQPSPTMANILKERFPEGALSRVTQRCYLDQGGTTLLVRAYAID